MRLFLILLLVSASASAEKMTAETKYEELAWQGLNLIDAYTTSRFRSRYPNCAQENGTWKALTGSHPTDGHIAFAAIVWGGAHYGITYALEANDAPRWSRRLWQAVTITGTGIQISSNVRTLTSRSKYYEACETLYR